MVVTGSVNHKNVDMLKNIYNQMPDPKAVVAVGACASTGGVFHGCYNVLGGVDKILPVDVYVPGCCPKPESIIDGIVQAAQILEEKRKNKTKGVAV
jgi:ech hydrogenase subunit C